MGWPNFRESVSTIQRIAASEGNGRGVVETLTKVVEAFDAAGVELIVENASRVSGGPGGRFRHIEARVPAMKRLNGQRRKRAGRDSVSRPEAVVSGNRP